MLVKYNVIVPKVMNRNLLLVSGTSGGMSRPRSRVDIHAAKQSESSKWIVNNYRGKGKRRKKTHNITY